MNTHLVPVVTLKDGIAFANSRDVAEFFDKRHDNVLRDIAALMSGGVLNFEETLHTHPQNGRTYRSYDMTKDGFTLLAMGFTGPKALQFKLAYIAAFNELEQKAHASVPVLPDFSNPVIAARAWADEVEKKQCLQIENQRLAPLAQIGQRAVRTRAKADFDGNGNGSKTGRNRGEAWAFEGT